MLTEAQKRANQKYNAKAYDQLKVLVKKGQRDQIRNYAESHGMSLNGYINKLIAADMGEALTKHQNEDTENPHNTED